jgi:hypothetical protein
MRILISLILLVFSCLTQAHEKLLENFLNGYAHGNTTQMGISADTKINSSKTASAVDVYQLFFSTTTTRALEFRNVHWNDVRITADYYALAQGLADGKKTQGSITLIVDKDDHITHIYHNYEVYAESTSNVSDTGQAADKLSTIAAISTGAGVEANPALAGFGPVGFVALGVGMIAIRNGTARTDSLESCIASSRGVGTFGWGAAGNNVAVLVGLGPIGIPVALVSGIVAHGKNYKGDCVDGPIRIASIKSI